jgi:hypothetical protein
LGLLPGILNSQGGLLLQSTRLVECHVGLFPAGTMLLKPLQFLADLAGCHVQ